MVGKLANLISNAKESDLEKIACKCEMPECISRVPVEVHYTNGLTGDKGQRQYNVCKYSATQYFTNKGVY